MCGIFVVISKKNKLLLKKHCLEALNDMVYRGPDWSYSALIKKNIFFGQNILSMTGKKVEDKSIFQSKSNKYNILFNGEIYNYKDLPFLTEYKNNDSLTDTEFLLSLIEKKGLDKAQNFLDGMYVYAVYNHDTNEIQISRDPQGEKSLYIYEDNEYLIFSSEVSAIIKFVKKNDLDLDILKTYFYSRHFMQLEKTIYKNIKLLPPGESRVYSLNNFKCVKKSTIYIRNWVSEVDYNRNMKRNFNDLYNELEYLLKKNLIQMIPSERKFASIISGGIDSSLITKYLNEICDPNLLIAIDHVGKDTITKNLKYFENKLQKKIKTISVDEKIYIKNLLEISRSYLTPIHSHSFVSLYILSKYCNTKKCKAIFGGEGADELFGGYDTYNQDISKYDKNFSKYSMLNKPNLFFDEDNYSFFHKKIDKNWNSNYETYSFIKNKNEQNRQASMLTDTNLQLSTVGLRGADLMCMRSSIEQRSIFLRKDIIKFALNLPIKHKINKKENSNYSNKYILKRIFENKYSGSLIFKKEGFAGFPNSVKKVLGDKKDYLIRNVLDFNSFDKLNLSQNRDLSWKIYNTEVFLRNHFNLF